MIDRVMSKLFTDEEVAAILEILYSEFGHRLSGERFLLDGLVEPGLVRADLAIEKLDKTFRYDMSFYVSLAHNELSVQEARDLVLDFLGWYLERYFEEDRELLLPLDYQPYNFGEHTVFARGDVRNPYLDALADAIIEEGKKVDPQDPRFRHLFTRRKREDG